MIKSKKQMFIVIGVFTLILLLGGVTSAFFNYTRTGSPNNFSVGRIFFKSDNEETITLSNLFPIDPENATDMADPTKVGTYSIDITGDTDYVDGLEYLVSITDANISNLPISIDVSVSNGLGTSSDNYFTARESKNASIYKRLMGNTITGDGMLFVGYVKPNTTSGTIEGVDGTITITAYLDKNKILISDTYDGTESDEMGTTNAQAEGKTVLTTTEWNALSTNGVSFKIKVEANEGIWVNESLEMIMKNNAVMDNISSEFVSASTGIDFGALSSDTNGKGVYIRSGTENDEYPIMYYRGAVDNNNVAFNNMCWKAVRTTETGGVKLIYNGETNDVYSYTALDQNSYTVLTNSSTNTSTFDSTDNSWNTIIPDNTPAEFSFTVPEGDNYNLKMSATAAPMCNGGLLYFYDNETDVVWNFVGYGNTVEFAYDFGTLTSSNVLKMVYTGGANNPCQMTVKLQILQKGDLINTNGCDNRETDTHIEVNGTNVHEFSGVSLNYSPAYVGYMYGNVYEVSDSNWTTNARFGSGFTWDGTTYKLTDATVTSPDYTHHYSCNSTDVEGTCQELRYVYYVNGSRKYYITINGGKGIDEALKEMQVNTTSSNAKTQIDAWYLSKMAEVTNRLEDTIWCNDRSIGLYNGWHPMGRINGNYSNETNYALLFGSYQRSKYSTNYDTKNQPSLECVNKNDRFTVNNSLGNKALTYPVALLTRDEIVLAGSVEGQDYNREYYLFSGSSFWSMTPGMFTELTANVFYVPGAQLSLINAGDYTEGLRPAISIKPGQMIKSGDGTSTNPYVIE